MTDSVAVIDVGTNSVLLLVARQEGNRVIALYEENQSPRIGTGLAETGLIARPFVARLVDTLRRYQNTCRQLRAGSILTVGTRVFRVAKNTPEVIRQIREKTDLKLRVLSARQEAVYAFSGALSGLPDAHDGVLVDVGGGSTEFVYFRRRKLVRSASLPLGAVTLAETSLNRFWHISDRRLAKAREELTNSVARLPVKFPASCRLVIGVGGTVTTVAALDQRLKTYRPERVQGYVLTGDKLAWYLRRFRKVTVSEIRRLIPFDPARASILPAGTFIWTEVLKHLCVETLVVSHRGLWWGVAWEHFGKTRP